MPSGIVYLRRTSSPPRSYATLGIEQPITSTPGVNLAPYTPIPAKEPTCKYDILESLTYAEMETLSYAQLESLTYADIFHK